MKQLHPILRAGLGIVLGFLFTVPLVLPYASNSAYTQIDRAFLFLIPVFSFAYLIFEISSRPFEWKFQWKAESPSVPRSPISEQTAAIPPSQYITAFFSSFMLCYFMLGFFDEAVKTTWQAALFAFLFISIACIFLAPIVSKISQSKADGFLSKPINLVMILALPVFLIMLAAASAQFPAMFVWQNITLRADLLGAYLISGCIAGALNVKIVKHPLIHHFYQTSFYQFALQHLPGAYAGGMFFFIHLILARALNHPAFSRNSVVFETDAGPWMTILASPQSDAINRAVHPLVLIFSRPVIRFFALFTGEYWNLAAMLVVALLGAACVFMAYVFVYRAVKSKTYAFLFAVFLGVTPSHLLFGSLTENYVFGMTSLIFFFLLVQSKEKRFGRLIPSGVIVFGITVANIAQTAIGLFFRKLGFWNVVRYCFLVLSAGVVLTTITNAVYPNKQTFFFVPADLAFEANFIRSKDGTPLVGIQRKAEVVARTMLLYQIAAPQPLIVISQKKNDPFPTIDLKTFDWRENKLASYKGLGNLPLFLWLILLAGGVMLFLKNLRTSPHTELTLGLLGVLGFNALLHLFYGTELFLYTPYWTYALAFFLALAYEEMADTTWFQAVLAAFVILLMLNNGWFLFVILRALAPFFSAV